MKEITIFETKDMESNYNKNKPHVHALKKMSLRTPMTFKKYINDSLLRIISTPSPRKFVVLYDNYFSFQYCSLT